MRICRALTCPGRSCSTPTSNAQLQDANVQFARLQGAELTGAQSQSADLSDAQLQGADLKGAQLPGADLRYAQLQGANLTDAQLQGADLRDAQLQGADLAQAALADAELNSAFFWRSNVADAHLSTAAVRFIRADQVYKDDNWNVRPLTPSDVEAWISTATKFAPESNNADIRARFARLRSDFRENEQEPTWSGIEEASVALDPDRENHRQRLGGLLGQLACAPDGAPDVARSLMGRGEAGGDARLASLGDQLESVRKLMKEGRTNPNACKGVVGFSDEDWRRLDALAPSLLLPR